MDQAGLFALPAPLPPATPVSAGVRRTMRQQALLRAGLNPATEERQLDGGATTCRSCCHAEKHQPTRSPRSYWKCRNHRLGLSSSDASDIRVSWPACALYAIGPQEPSW